MDGQAPLRGDCKDDTPGLANAQRRLHTLAEERFLECEFTRRKPIEQTRQLLGKGSQPRGDGLRTSAETKHPHLDDAQRRLRTGNHDVRGAHRQRRGAIRRYRRLRLDLEAAETDDQRAWIDAQDPNHRHATSVHEGMDR